MTQKLFLLLLASSLVFSCNRNDTIGELVEVSGRVFTDSTHTQPVAGAEVVLLQFSSFFFSRRFYDPIDTVLTDNMGNYSLSTISEENRNYGVWLKPNLFTSASGPRIERLREWEPNDIDLQYVDPILLTIEVIGDSLCDDSLDQITGTLYLEANQQLESFFLGYFIQEEIPLTWSRDTTFSLFVGPRTTLNIGLWQDLGFLSCVTPYGLGWNNQGRELEVTDSTTIRLSRR